jgi:hypothetical protein
MGRLLLRYLSPTILALSPLFTNQYSLLDLIGIVPDSSGVLHLGFGSYLSLVGPKVQVEMQLRAWITAVGIGALLLSGYFDAYAPSRTLTKFRHDFLQEVCRAEWRKRGRLRSDIRINVMYLRWRFFFRVIWRDGFQPSDRDFGVRLMIWQGVCGKAARRKEAVFVDFRSMPQESGTFANRWLLGNKFRLFGWQLKKTRDLKAILSVPIYETVGQLEKAHEICVGVINVDTKTDAGATHLAGKTRDLAVFLAKHGTLIAKMR